MDQSCTGACCTGEKATLLPAKSPEEDFGRQEAVGAQRDVSR